MFVLSVRTVHIILSVALLLQLPPTVQKHEDQVDEVLSSMWVCELYARPVLNVWPLQGVFLPLSLRLLEKTTGPLALTWKGWMDGWMDEHGACLLNCLTLLTFSCYLTDWISWAETALNLLQTGFTEMLNLKWVTSASQTAGLHASGSACQDCPLHQQEAGQTQQPADSCVFMSAWWAPSSDFLSRFFFHLFLSVLSFILSHWEGTRPGLFWSILNGSSVCPPSHRSGINKIIRTTAASDQLHLIMQRCSSINQHIVWCNVHRGSLESPAPAVLMKDAVMWRRSFTQVVTVCLQLSNYDLHV